MVSQLQVQNGNALVYQFNKRPTRTVGFVVLFPTLPV